MKRSSSGAAGQTLLYNSRQPAGALAVRPDPLPSPEHLRSLSQQASDFIVYLAIPALALVLPVRWSRALVARASNWSWLMAPACEQAWVQAAAHTRIADEREWKRQWRRVEMIDARDTYMLGLGRKRAVLGEIAQNMSAPGVANNRSWRNQYDRVFAAPAVACAPSISAHAGSLTVTRTSFAAASPLFSSINSY